MPFAFAFPAPGPVTRLTFTKVQAFWIGGGFYLRRRVEDTLGKLWDDSPLPDRLYPGPSDLRQKIDSIPDLRHLRSVYILFLCCGSRLWAHLKLTQL